MVSISDLFRYTVVFCFFLNIIMVSFVICPPDWGDFFDLSEKEITKWNDDTNELTLKKEISTNFNREYDNVTVKVNFYNNNSECFESINVTNNTTNHKMFINTVVKLPERPKKSEFKIIHFNPKTIIGGII